MHANYQLTNEIASFVIVINYSNKALSNKRPVPKSGNYPCDLNIMHPTHRRSLARFVESDGCTQAIWA